MIAALGDFLGDNLERRRAPGEWDCCGMPAAWSIALGTRDPMAAWRGRYSTDVEAEEIIFAEGGLAGIFGRGLEAVGWQRVEGEPQAGDLGVAAILDDEAGVLYTGRRWAFVAPRGLGFASLDREAVPCLWRFPPRG